MSREDDVKTLSAGLHEFSTGNEWETLGVAAAIAAFVDARIREMMVAHVTSAVHVPAPVEPEASAAKTSEAPCSCREIQAADPSRHFKGCARRVEKADAPYRGEIRSMGLAREWLQHHWPMEPPNALVWSLAEVIAAERAWRSAKELEAKAARDPPAAKPPEPSKPAAVGPEPPERVTLYWYGPEDPESWCSTSKPADGVKRFALVRASAYEKAVELLRSAVERWPSYNVRDDVVAFLRAHDAAAGKNRP